MFLSFSKKWNREFSKQNENGRVDNKKYVDLKKALINISGHNIYPAPERKNEEMESVFNTVLNAYKCIYRRGDLDHGADFVFTEQAIRSGFVWGAEQILGETELLEAIPNQLTPEMMERMVDVLTAYSRNHKITPDTISGFSKKLFPAIKNNDPETIPLQKASNSWGMHPGDFGIADFVCRSYALEVNPENIRELLMISREVPTTDQSKFERNRLDALSLVSTFGILRDFIHDQRPLVHEAIEQMVRYYENGDADSLEAVLKKTDYLAGDEARSALLDRTRYDKVIYERMPGNQDGPTIKVIEVLRRLEQNTAPHKSAAPKTTDNELNAQLKTLEQKTDLTGLEEALRYTNNKLAEMMKNSEIGMEPSTVIALGWLEQKVFEFLRDMDLEKQVGAPSSTWFREILRFNELTSSPNNYDENEFNAYLEELKNEPEKAYKKIGKRVLDNISALSESFKKKGRKDLGPLWSGNISHELVSLIDPRTASTKIGKRIGEEMRKSISEPGYHPGD